MMKFFENKRIVGKIMAAAIAAAVIGMSTTPAFAAENDTSELNSDMYQFSQDLAIGKAEIAPDGMIEYSCDIEDLDREGLTIVEHSNNEGIGVYRPQKDVCFGPYSYDWTCNPDTRHISDEIYIRKDNGYIGAGCLVSPADKTFWLGIMDDCGHAKYVEGQSNASHNFYGVKKGKYRVFIQNNYKKITLYAHILYGFSYDDSK